MASLSIYKTTKFEKLSLIESRDGSKIDFENKYDIFIKAIYPKPPEVPKGCSNFNPNSNPNPNFEGS